MEQPDVSLIVPTYNEALNLEDFSRELHAALATLNSSYEIIFVDDASTDSSLDTLKNIQKNHDHIRVLSLLRNTKKGGALKVGFAEAKGKTLITLDADLQDDPKDIGMLMAAINEGADVVVGWKKHRKDPLHKRIASLLINSISRTIFRNDIHDMNSGFKAYRAHTVKELDLYGSLYRFIPHLLHSMGYKVHEVPVHHRAREKGQSKFGFRHRCRGLFDLLTVAFLTKYGDRPLHLFGGIGCVMLIPGIIIEGRLTYLWLQGHTIGDRPLLLLGVLLIVVGMQFVSMGLLGELLIQQQHRKGSTVPFKEITN